MPSNPESHDPRNPIRPDVATMLIENRRAFLRFLTRHAGNTWNTCGTACEHSAASCLHEQDITTMVRCIELDRDCADIRSLAAQFTIYVTRPNGCREALRVMR